MSAAILIARPTPALLSEPVPVEQAETKQSRQRPKQPHRWVRGWLRRRLEDVIVLAAGVIMGAIHGTLGWHSLRRAV